MYYYCFFVKFTSLIVRITMFWKLPENKTAMRIEVIFLDLIILLSVIQSCRTLISNYFKDLNYITIQFYNCSITPLLNGEGYIGLGPLIVQYSTLASMQFVLVKSKEIYFKHPPSCTCVLRISHFIILLLK
jgi:hypothetical protein